MKITFILDSDQIQALMGCVNEKYLKADMKVRDKRKMSMGNPQKKEEPTNSNSEPALGMQEKEQVIPEKEKEEGSSLQMEKIQEDPQVKTILQSYEKCSHYYSEHDIDHAYQYAIQFQKDYELYLQGGEVSQIVLGVSEPYLRFIAQVKEEYDDVIACDEEVRKGTWVLKSNKKGVKISTKREQSSVGTLVEAEIEEPFEILISLLIQMDLYKNFMPFMKVSRQEKVVARNCRIGFTENHIPIISIREAFFQGIGYNRLHHDNTIFLMTRSIHNRKDLQQKLGYQCKINPKHVQLEYKYFALKYSPICKGRGKMVLAMNVDTKMDFIPMWLQDKISQDFGNEFYHNLVRLSRKFKGSQWEENVERDPTLFNFFKQKIDQYLEKNPFPQNPK